MRASTYSTILLIDIVNVFEIRFDSLSLLVAFDEYNLRRFVKKALLKT